MKNRLINLGTEFTMVFFGVLLAFLTNNWAENRKEKKYVSTIIGNLIEDVRKDSTEIIRAIDTLRIQHDSIKTLIQDLYVMNHKKANKNIECAYSSYNSFDPTTETFESMIFGGDMKLVEDRMRLKSIKDLDHVNNNIRDLHAKYYENIESFRNSFICQYNIEFFDFGNIEQERGTEFWNRLKFLSASVEDYYKSLKSAQEKYNTFLREFRNTEF